jgi:hypothetical protein
VAGAADADLGVEDFPDGGSRLPKQAPFWAAKSRSARPRRMTE